MAGNSNLHMSKSGKTDEFYTQISMIENELKHYKEHFKGKVVFCNADDPYESNFFKYFALNFNQLGLKKLIATCYSGSPIAGKEMGLFENQGHEYRISGKRAYKVVMSELKDVNGDGRQDIEDVQELIKHRIRYLQDDGDFRSEECIALLQEADIIVTNPPFSLFKEYISLLMQYQKKFLVIGNQNAVTYKEIFPLIKNNEIWLGYNNGHFWFKVPDDYEVKKTDFKIDDTGQKWRRMGNICWFTNLDINKRHEELVLFQRYEPEKYPKYDNYDAINVNATKDIPCDYYGAMGVPITFLDKYNPEQFELVKFRKGDDDKDLAINGKCPYFRILIRRVGMS